MTIVPAWIKEQTEAGVLAVLGSEPRADAVEVFISKGDIQSVVIAESSPVVAGRQFGVIVLKQVSEIVT
jgi:hypothetical protein